MPLGAGTACVEGRVNEPLLAGIWQVNGSYSARRRDIPHVR